MDSAHSGPPSSGVRRRRVPIGRTAAFWLAFLGVCLPALVDAGPLPRLAVSVAARPDLTSALGTLGRLAGAEGVIVTPALDFDVSTACNAPVDAGDLLAITRAVTAKQRVLVHIRIRASELSADARAQESTLERCVTELAAVLPTASGAVKGAILEIGPSPGNLGLLQFALAALVLRLKAATPSLEIAVVFPSGFLRAEQEITRRVTAYAEMVGIAYSATWQDEAEWARAELHKPLLLHVSAGRRAGEPEPATIYLDMIVRTGDTLIDTLWSADPSQDQAAALAQTQSALMATLKTGFTSAPLSKAPASLQVDDGPLEASAFIDSTSPDVAFLVKTDGTLERPRRLTVSGRFEGGFGLTCHDARDGRSFGTSPLQTVDKRASQTCSAAGPFAIVAIRRGEAGERLYEAVSVVGRGELSVEEIVARWQQQRESQKRRIENYSAECLLTLHFEATALGSGFDVSMQMRVFADRTGQRDWIQDALYVNGVRFKSSRGFPLPQLEPEKVVTQPLELALDEKYRYALLGTETIGSAVTYVVGIEPEQAGAVLFSGKVWIDGLSFRQVRMQLQQKGGRSNVQSSMETQDFDLLGVEGGQPFNVLRSTYVQQVVNAAGRSFLVEKTYKFTNHLVNSPTFEHTLTEARASDRRMFRDTEQGLRTLRSEKGIRVVEPASSRIRSLLVGTLFEGSYSFPIPLAGFSLVDFDFRKTGTQLSLFFAGPIVAVDLSKQISQRLRVGVDVALSAIPRNERVFAGATEVLSESFWNFEESTGVLANWQMSTNLSLHGSSYLTANFFRPTSDTALDFRARGRGYTVQTSGELKFARNGFAVTTNVTSGLRFGWSDLGYASAPNVMSGTTFVKYSGEFAKQFYLTTFSKLSVGASYYGGDRLDRLSRYQPSFLSRPRIRGVPNGTDAFDAVGVVGLSYGFNVFDVVKVEGLYNRAWGQNLDESRRFKTFEGLELGLGTVGPWGTFVQGSVTYALQGNLERYRSRWGVYLLVFKPLGR